MVVSIVSVDHCSVRWEIMSNDERFPKSLRILRQADFDAVYRSQVFAADPVLVIRAVKNMEASSCRLGLSISRKVGNAVVRNRWKRRIREAFRRNKRILPNGIDLVVRPRKGATPDFDAIQSSLIQLSKRLSRQLNRSQQDNKNSKT